MNAETKVRAESLSAAMAAAFQEIEAATKDSENPAFKQGGKAIRYADLSAVIGAVKPALINHGLFFTQHCHPSEDGVIVETVLGHVGGEEKSLGKLYVPANKRDAQGFGSALTYARRYALMTAFGVPAEDDDGNAAARAIRNNANDTGELIDDAQWASLIQLIEAGNADTQRFCAYMKVPDLKSIRKADYQRAADALKAKIPAKAA